MSEWIEWTGGERPVSVGTIIDVRFRNGQVHTGVAAGMSGVDGYGNYIVSVQKNDGDAWRHRGMASDIVAYRICKPDAKEARRAVFQSMLDGVKTKAPEEPKRVAKKPKVRT